MDMYLVKFVPLIGKSVTFSTHSGDDITGTVVGVVYTKGCVTFQLKDSTGSNLITESDFSHIVAVSEPEDVVSARKNYSLDKDYEVAVTHGLRTVDPKKVLEVYDTLSDLCTDKEGYTDLPLLLSYLGRLNLEIVTDVERDQGKDIRDECIYVIMSMLPETDQFQQRKREIEDRVREEKEDY